MEPIDMDKAAAPLRDTGPSAVIAGIIHYLRERRLQPGDRLPSERDLAERLGAGRNAVREALATLVTLRMVESRPNSGIYLRHVERESSFEAMVMLADMGATPTPTEVAETMEVRAHLETLSVRLACSRRSDGDLAKLEEILDRTDAELAANGNIASLDTAFQSRWWTRPTTRCWSGCCMRSTDSLRAAVKRCSGTGARQRRRPVSTAS